MRIRRARYFSVHTHSEYSVNDAMGTVASIVQRSRELGYRGLALTDHGNIAGTVELYKECRKAGIKPFPGCEMYLVEDRSDKSKATKRYHFGVFAYTTQGYRNLVNLVNLSHENFYHKPIVDLADLARLKEEGRTEGLALTTGCYFGYVTQVLVNEGPKEARRVVGMFKGWFDTYIELQKHKIYKEDQDEDWIADQLIGIADYYDLPIVLGQDSHYTHKELQPVHDGMKRLATVWADPDDSEFPGDGFHLVDDQWMIDHHGQEVYERAMLGHERLLDLHDMDVEEMESYTYRIPHVVDDPEYVIARTLADAAEVMGLTSKRYKDRLLTELETIRLTGMSDYLLLVADVCRYMREQGIEFQTRGSAAGSLVCYLLGITNVDPVKWGTSFDRFMGKPKANADGTVQSDRKSPPDIDLDVDNTRRAEIIEWLNQRYSVMQIGNWSEMGFKTDSTGGQTSSETGSIVVKYYSAQRRKLAKEGYTREQINERLEWVNVPDKDKEMLQRLSDIKPLSGSGTHACGLILCNSQDEMDLMVPKMWVPNSKIFVSQFNMKRVEEIGLVKLDLLGSKTVAVMSRVAKELGYDSIDHLKESAEFTYTDTKVFSAMGRGNTEGVFQLEGYSSMMGVKELKPRKISDVVAAMALFRPATMDAGATQEYMDRRFNRAQTPERHPLFESAIKLTNGIILYQDQVIDILRALGMDAADLTIFLKAIKASNKNQAGAKRTIDHYMPIVKRLCDAQGVSEEDWSWLQGAFQAAAGYGFNKAHATVYGITAYLTQWMRVHHPDVFFANLISVHIGDPDRVTKYERVARRSGVRILRADVLESDASNYRVVRPGVIRRPLQTIKGVGAVAAAYIQEAQPFRNFEEFLDRANYSKITGLKDFKPGVTTEAELKGVLKNLHEAGAVDSIGGVPLGVSNE